MQHSAQLVDSGNLSFSFSVSCFYKLRSSKTQCLSGGQNVAVKMLKAVRGDHCRTMQTEL